MNISFFDGGKIWNWVPNENAAVSKEIARRVENGGFERFQREYVP
jgi:hypothetical protein